MSQIFVKPNAMVLGSARDGDGKHHIRLIEGLRLKIGDDSEFTRIEAILANHGLEAIVGRFWPTKVQIYMAGSDATVFHGCCDGGVRQVGPQDRNLRSYG